MPSFRLHLPPPLVQHLPLCCPSAPPLLQADDGFLYPLERAFFYVQKPPLLLVFDDVDSVEFMRQVRGRGGGAGFAGFLHVAGFSRCLIGSTASAAGV